MLFHEEGEHWVYNVVVWRALTMLLFVDCSASMRRESIGCFNVVVVDCSASMRRESIGCSMLLRGGTMLLFVDCSASNEEGEHWVYNVVC